MGSETFKTYRKSREKWGRATLVRAIPWFRITEDGEIAIAPKGIEGYKAQVRSPWDARQSLTSKQLIKQWQEYSVGWWNYFKLVLATLINR